MSNNQLAMEGHQHKDYIPALQRRIQELENEIRRLTNGNNFSTNE